MHQILHTFDKTPNRQNLSLFVFNSHRCHE